MKVRKGKSPIKKEHPSEKIELHLRNAHRQRYPLEELIMGCPELSAFVNPNSYNDLSIDFHDSKAVLALNKALLMRYYCITWWQIPKNYLCPPIPGRADYIHNVADILATSNHGKIPTGNAVTCLDIGVGANCVYPIIGNHSYGWSFIGSDIDEFALQSSSAIVANNSTLKGKVDVRLQPNGNHIFQGLLTKDDRIDMVVCNPPFHASLKDAQKGTAQKLSRLHQKKVKKPELNFGGQGHELWCTGGEAQFIETMITESKSIGKTCLWFSTLVSKSSNLPNILEKLEATGPIEIRTLPMGQGNKISRLVAWTFLQSKEHKKWAEIRWFGADN